MISYSFRRSLLQLKSSTSNFRGRVAPTTTRSGVVRLTQERAFTNTCQVSVAQMARKKKDDRGKGIKRKRHKQETPYFGGRMAQARARRDAAMNERNDDPGRDQRRERENLASELWNQQHQQYHHQQQPVYQTSSWSQAPHAAPLAPAPAPPPPSWPQTPFGAPVPHLPHNFNPQSASFSPSWGPSGWPPRHNQHLPPQPPPQGAFPPRGSGAPAQPPGHNYRATTNSNTPYFYESRGDRHNPSSRPYTSASDSRRNYSTVSRSRHNANGTNEINLIDGDTDHYSPPPAEMGKITKLYKRNKNKNKNREDKSQKEPPSAASGGVPSPTKEYLLQASEPPVEIPPDAPPRPMLVVIDLNGTLVFRKDARTQPHKCIIRPHAEAFLAHCFAQGFKVAIWSSAQPKNVNIMVEDILPSEAQRSKLVVQWARDKFGLTQADSRRPVQCYKRLTKLWEDEAVKATGEWDQTNTVLIDDSIEKAKSEPHNSITIPEFEGDMQEEPLVLKLVQDYLDVLARQADVSRYIQRHPFKKEPGATEETKDATMTDGQRTTEESAAAGADPDEIDLDSPEEAEADE